MERRLAAILAADVVGYSRLMRANEEATLDRLKTLRAEVLDPRITAHHGRIFKTTGDGALVEFASAVDAVRCAVEVQSELIRQDGDPALSLRIGINVGDIIVEADDIYGDGVNIAARLEDLAEPGGVCLSASAHEQVRDKLDIAFEDLGEQCVKNIDQPVRVYRIAPGSPAACSTESDQQSLSLPDKPSIAVLPFAHLSGDPEKDFFADGITEEVITILSKVSGLFVIARNSTLIYKDRAVDIREVGREQGVQYVLEGSVRHGGNRVRVTAQLIEAAAGRHVWAQRYDREIGDVFALQDNITKEIVSSLQVELTAGDQARLAAQGTQNAEAWQLAFEGRDLVHQHHKDSVRKGRALLEQAVRLDENYAFAWQALAEAHWKDSRNRGWSPSRERSFELSIEAIDRALSLDPENPDILAMRSILMVTERNFDNALAMAEKALRLAYSDANAIALAVVTLYACGKADEGLRQMTLAKRFCPRHPPWYPMMEGRCHWALGQIEEAIAGSRAAVAADPNFSLGYAELAIAYAEAGRDREARAAVENLLLIDPSFSAAAYQSGLPLQDAGLDARRRTALERSGVPD